MSFKLSKISHSDQFLFMLNKTDDRGFIDFDKRSIDNLIEYMKGYSLGLLEKNQVINLVDIIYAYVESIVKSYFVIPKIIEKSNFEDIFKQIEFEIIKKIINLIPVTQPVNIS